MQIVMNICKCFPLTLQIIFIYTGRHPAKMTIGCKIMHLLRYAKMHTEDLIKSDMFYDNVTTISQLISYCVDAYLPKNVRCYVFITNEDNYASLVTTNATYQKHEYICLDRQSKFR